MCIKTIAKIIRETALVLALSAFTVAVILFFTSGDIIISKAPKSYDENIYEEGLMPLEADLIYYTYKHDIIDEYVSIGVLSEMCSSNGGELVALQDREKIVAICDSGDGFYRMSKLQKPE